MKSTRQNAILDIITNNEIYTQEGILEKLKLEKFDVTQATVSRDVKEMNLLKVVTPEGKYKYSMQREPNGNPKSVKFHSVFKQAVISVDYAMNTVVIKCHTGMANAACAALDSMKSAQTVGTLAGDDTIFVLQRNEISAKRFAANINDLLEFSNE
ncbi:MAG: arginine repressor [Oscillospiraceae bacterium]